MECNPEKCENLMILNYIFDSPSSPGRMRGFSRGLAAFCLLIGELGH